MGKRDKDSGAELPRLYEGAAVLGELLAVAGSAMAVDDVKSLLAEAVAEGVPPGEAFPELFEDEPRFPSPELARRLYGNLFGLWDRLAAGETEEPRTGRPPKPAPPPVVVPPAPIEGNELPDAFVEEAFRALTALAKKERQKLRDRFEQRESDLVEVLHRLDLAAEAEGAGLDLAFELWAMCEWALGARVGRTNFTALQKPATATNQPALLRYVDEWLGEAELDETEPLGAADRAKLEALLRAAVALLAP